MYNQNDENPVIKMVKTMITSPLFLVCAIGYSAGTLFEFMGGIWGNSSIGDMLDQIWRISGSYSMDYDYIQSYMTAYNGVRIATALIAAIPSILIVVGIWMLFASAKNEAQTGLNVTGLTMIHVIVLIQLVFLCVGAVFLELACIAAMIGASAVMSYGYGVGDSLSFILVIMMIIIAAWAAVKILYYLKLNQIIKKMKETAVSGRPDPQMSLYVEIFCYILGGVSALSALTSLAGFSMYGFLGSAGVATAHICFGIYLRKYRREMELLQSRLRKEMRPPYQQQEIPPSYQQQEIPPSYQQQETPPSYQQQVPLSSYQPQYQETPSASQESETTVLPYYNDTSVLSGQFMSDGRIQLVRMTRQKNGETICISKPSFWIGKDMANVDYCITDNSAVSRRHALVTIQNGNCYIRDNRSTNRVFVNGQAVLPDEDILLSDGDRIRLADEEFAVSIG